MVVRIEGAIIKAEREEMEVGIEEIHPVAVITEKEALVKLIKKKTISTPEAMVTTEGN